MQTISKHELNSILSRESHVQSFVFLGCTLMGSSFNLDGVIEDEEVSLATPKCYNLFVSLSQLFTSSH